LHRKFASQLRPGTRGDNLSVIEPAPSKNSRPTLVWAEVYVEGARLAEDFAENEEQTMASDSAPEVQLAIFVGEKLAGAIIGSAASELVANPLMALLGIKTNQDKSGEYHREVMNQLKSLGESLNNHVRALQASLGQIKNISTEIKDFMTQEALAAVLRDYNTNAATIENAFELFTNNVAALSSPDPRKVDQAVTDMYKVFSENATGVSAAMKRIHNLMVEPTDFDKSIVGYLHDAVRQQIGKFAESDEKYAHNFRRADDGKSSFLPREYTYYESGRIVTNAHKVARTELPKMERLFRRILATQLRGLIFLTRAWEGSTHAPTLRRRADELLTEIRQVQLFYPNYVRSVEESAADNLKRYGKSLSEEMLRLNSKQRRDWKGRPEPGGFLSKDWVMMRVEENEARPPHLPNPEDFLWLVYQPWKKAAELPATADRFCHLVYVRDGGGKSRGLLSGAVFPPSFGEEYGLVGRTSETLDKYMYPDLAKLEPGAPLLAGVPSTEDELMRAGLKKILEDARAGKTVSFKCASADGGAAWLEGSADKFKVGLAKRRGAVSKDASTEWRIFTAGNDRVYVKCLNPDRRVLRYLNGVEGRAELVENLDPAVSGGTEWLLRLWEDGRVSLVRVHAGGTSWLQGRPSDATVEMGAYMPDAPGMKWTIYPFMEDTN
jgi:hypothetical protein